MGNTLLETTDKYPLKQFDSWSEQKPELSGSKLLFESKIFHTMCFNLKNQNASIVMKVYLKESDFDSKNSRAYRDQFEHIKRSFNPQKYPNLLPFRTLMNFEPYSSSATAINFVVVARQQIYQTLSDRYLYKPSLSIFEKQWILLQTLIALYCVHTKEKLFHGALRPSNILLTTSNHVFLADFANYKPLFIDEINQIRDLRFFYKTHENNSTLAPEKFQSASKQEITAFDNIPADLLVQLQQMDIFSLGCVISDLYLDGEQPLFTYEQIQKFKTKTYSPEPIIRKISYQPIRTLVEQLILEEDCSKRLKITEIWEYFRKEIMGDSQQMLLLYCMDVAIQSNQLSKPDFRVALIKEMLKVIHKVIIKKETDENLEQLLKSFRFSLPLSLQKIDFMQKLQDAVLNLNFNVWELFGETQMPQYLQSSSAFSVQHKDIENTQNLKEKDFKLCQELFNQYKSSQKQYQQKQIEKQSLNSTNNNDSSQSGANKILPEESPELGMVVMLLCTNLRTVQYAASKLVGLEVLSHLSDYLRDLDILHLVLPFVCDQLEDFELSVAEYAFEVFCKLLSRLTDPFENLNDTALYKSFIFTNFQKCAKNNDIRRSFITNSIQLAQSCINICNLSIKAKQQFIQDAFNNSVIDMYSRTQSVIRNIQIDVQSSEKQEKEVIDIVKDTFKRSLSDCPADISNLAIAQLPKFLAFLKNDPDRDTYMNLFISCLNRAERKLSCLESMFDIIVQISDSQQKMFALCLKDSLYESNELLAQTALTCSWKLVEKDVLDKNQVYEFVDAIGPLILHPHNWIRKEAIKFFEVVLSKFDPIQVFLDIQPKIIKYMTEDVAIINKEILQLILPRKIDKRYVDFNTRKCTMPGQLGELEARKDLELFQNNYLARCKLSREQFKAVKDEELKQFQQKFEVISSRQLQRQGFIKKLIDFLTAAFKSNFLGFLNLASEKYRVVTSQMDEKQIDKLMVEFFRDQRLSLDINSLGIELNSDLQKFLNQMQLELSINYDSCMTKCSLIPNHYHKNFATALISLNEFILKLQQFEVQEEIDVGKPFFYDPATGYAPPQNSLKVWHPQGSLVTTIYEHSDVVSNLESVQNNKLFISASYDGTVRIFDITNLEQDFTSDSIAQIQCKDDKDASGVGKNHKIKVIKMIQDSGSVLVGTEKGTIFLYNIEKCYDMKIAADLRTRNLQTIYGTGEIRCLESFRNENDKCFLYATSKGEIGVRDIRSKSIALSNNIGKERGLISSMVLAPGFSTSSQSTAVISTLNGYCLMYDLRCNLLSHNYLLLNTEEQALPIVSMSNFYRYANIDTMGKQSDLLAMSYVSDNHEVAMFNLNQMVDSMNPSLYMLSTKNYNPTFQAPMLKLLTKQESLNYCNKNTLKDMMDYDFVPNFAQQVNVLDYLTDPLVKNQNAIKLRLLEQSKNCFQNIQSVHTCQNYVSKILCLPSFPADPSGVIPKTAQNSIITCGNDRNIRLWPMVSDPPSKSNYSIDTQIKGFHISNVDNHQRNFSQKKIANLLILHEYTRASFQQSSIYATAAKKKSLVEEFNYPTFNPQEKRSAHADTITDMIYMERDNGALLLTSSRDKTIKIWK